MAELPRPFNGRRFESGIGSLDAYDQTVTPIVELLKNMPAQSAPASVQDPVAARFIAPTVPTLQQEYEDRRDTYRGILGDPAEQRKMTQAQMLFDIANTALAFSTAGSRPGMSPAERLAEAAVETKLFPTIAARTAAQKEQQQKFDLAALQSAETSLAAKEKAAADYREALLKKKPQTVTVDGQVVDITDPNNPRVIFGTKARKTTTIDGQLIDYTDPNNPRVVFGTKKPSTVTLEGQIIDISDKDNPVVLFGDRERKTTTIDGQLIDFTDANNPIVLFGTKKADTVTVKGQIIDISDKDNPIVLFGDKDAELRTIKGQIINVSDPDKPVVVFGDRERELRSVNGQVIDFTDPQNPEVLFGDKDRDYRLVEGQVVDVTDPNNTFVVFGEKKRDVKTDALGRLVDITDPSNPEVIWDVETRSRPKLQNVTIDGIPQVVDVNTPEGMNAVELANEANRQRPGRASVTSVTSAPKPRSFVVNKPDGSSMFITSYDNGLTYPDADGLPQPVPEGAYPVSDTVADEVNKGIRASSKAGDLLQALDEKIAVELGLNPDEFSQEDITAVVSALEMAREGTGFYSNFVALLDGISSVLPEFARDFVAKFTKDNQAARQYLRGVITLGRSALVVNPRFPVAEMQKVEELFVRPETFFANPSTEANKFIEMKSLALQQYRRNLTELEKGVPKAQREQIEANNFELQRLMSLLPGVPLPGATGGTQDSLVDEASAIMFNQ